MSAVENVADVLDAAADLLAKPGRWAQNQIARDADGNPTSAIGRRAVCFCAGGAIVRAAGGSSNAGAPLRAFRMILQGVSLNIADFNDAPGRTQSEVVAKLREAAALARQEQAA